MLKQGWLIKPMEKVATTNIAFNTRVCFSKNIKVKDGRRKIEFVEFYYR